jgi:hypothetical protein
VQPCSGRLELGSGEVSASAGQEVLAQAPLGPILGTGVVGRPWLQEEGWLGGGSGHGATAELQRHERKRRVALYSLEHALGVLLRQDATRGEERGSNRCGGARTSTGGRRGRARRRQTQERDTPRREPPCSSVHGQPRGARPREARAGGAQTPRVAGRHAAQRMCAGAPDAL